MNKSLSEMTLEELWDLFPIILTEHNPQWREQFREEVEGLKKLLPPDTEYHHIGSTAVDGIKAKPIVDILIIVKNLKKAASLLEKSGYIVMSASDTRISLNKGYTQNGFAEKVFHLHLRLGNDKDEIYFRDYLNAHRDVAKEYEALKLGLWKKYEHDRDAYTDGKTEFVKRYTVKFIELKTINLDSFERLQHVEECWRKEDGEYKLLPVKYTEDWSLSEKRELAQRISDGLASGNIAFGAVINGEVAGFAYLDTRLFGSKSQYMDLAEFYVSAPYRRTGIGRRLFETACRAAFRRGAAKLYISAHSAKESIAAYKSYGCVPAEEVNEELAEKEPCDLQLEYALG